ncbi:uncharacterized protein An01g06140 [Aspergillus niger]|uniref:Contig An01c0210, genomic contig n=2 Tax=Aspergillus niger TaxID=5061 RepID=A2Q8Z9_ASPNC|nr:uncharacterized protein An01g06140 [Aspergillus niger]CAK37089.1 unnamed protein product [Aspergillus niger]
MNRVTWGVLIPCQLPYQDEEVPHGADYVTLPAINTMSSQPGTNCTVVMCEWVQRHAFRFRSRIRSPIELSSKQSSHEVEQFVHRSCPEGPKTLSSLVFLPLEDLLEPGQTRFIDVDTRLVVDIPYKVVCVGYDGDITSTDSVDPSRARWLQDIILEEVEPSRLAQLEAGSYEMHRYLYIDPSYLDLETPERISPGEKLCRMIVLDMGFAGLHLLFRLNTGFN